jgi:hypothetical protein
MDEIIVDLLSATFLFFGMGFAISSAGEEDNRIKAFLLIIAFLLVWSSVAWS